MIEIAVSVITGVFTLVGVILTVIFGNKKARSEVSEQVTVSLAVFETERENLTREVREHNNFGVKIAAIESRIAALEAVVKK